MKLVLTLLIFLTACNQPEKKEYFKKEKFVIRSITAKKIKNGFVMCTLKLEGKAGYVVVDGEKGSCLSKGDTVELITYNN